MISYKQELEEPKQELHSNKVGFIIRDQEGNIVNKYTFQRMPNGRGKKPDWLYFSRTHYMSGMVVYPSATCESIQEIYTYLVNTNDRLGLDKQFCIVPINKDDITDDLVNNRGHIITEELFIN